MEERTEFKPRVVIEPCHSSELDLDLPKERCDLAIARARVEHPDYRQRKLVEHEGCVAPCPLDRRRPPSAEELRHGLTPTRCAVNGSRTAQRGELRALKSAYATHGVVRLTPKFSCEPLRAHLADARSRCRREQDRMLPLARQLQHHVSRPARTASTCHRRSRKRPAAAHPAHRTGGGGPAPDPRERLRRAPRPLAVV